MLCVCRQHAEQIGQKLGCPKKPKVLLKEKAERERRKVFKKDLEMNDASGSIGSGVATLTRSDADTLVFLYFSTWCFMFARNRGRSTVGGKEKKQNGEILVSVCILWMLDSSRAVLFSVQRSGNSAFVLRPSSAQPLPLRRESPGQAGLKKYLHTPSTRIRRAN